MSSMSDPGFEPDAYEPDYESNTPDPVELERELRIEAEARLLIADHPELADEAVARQAVEGAAACE